ncbi:hypothetical protein ACEPAF_5797 [Sanghuangporus sanghuang]
MPKNASQALVRTLHENSSRNGGKDRDGGTERVETRSVAVLRAPVSSSPCSIVLPDTPTESDTALSAVQEQIRQLQEELISEKRNREEDQKKLTLLEQRVEGLGEDADDEGDGGRRARKRRKKAGRKSTRHLILMKKGVELTSAEKQTKKRLRNAIIYELHEQSGIKNKKNAALPSPENAGEQVVNGKKILVPDLSESVEHFANELLIEQAVHIVDNDQELNKVYGELDKLIEERLAKKKKAHIRVPRVCFNDVFVDVPPVKIYPFMIDEMWYEDHVRNTSFEVQLQQYARDPAGFGSRKDEIVLTNLNEATPDSDAETSSDDSSNTDGSEA